ncbi:transcription factor bHLH167-like [Cornus florida]|uniref:transcription factor bHLH167-like n=1 Tax=Cornus florida TaxID=4283 RepID=UPI00289C31B9|nr:transcription factor bHLH167-like [Cornus florida]
MQPESSSLKVGRNVMEKKRRMHMNHLFSTISSLIFTQTPKERLALPVLLEQATNYIKGLKESIQELQRRKEQLTGDQIENTDALEGSALPVIAVDEMGSTLEVKLITGLNKNFMLHQVLSVLEEEGVEVVTASYSTVGTKTLYTIHSQAIWSRIGIETSRVEERLNKLVF